MFKFGLKTYEYWNLNASQQTTPKPNLGTTNTLRDESEFQSLNLTYEDWNSDVSI